MAETGVGFTTLLTYNAYSFDASARIEITEKPIWDDARRAILYQEITIKVTSIVAAPDSSTLNNTMQLIRARLNEPGRQLTFKNAGFGDDLLVNQLDGSGVRDVKFGPKPEVHTWNQIGSSRAVECVWSVTVCVPTCNNSGSLRSSKLMALNYSVSTSLDDGYATRTTAGYLQICLTRVPGTKRIDDCADLYRSLVNPTKPANFTRRSDWDVSADKSRVDFAITDTENRSDQAYPQFVIRPVGRHRVGWRRDGNAMTLVGTISMELELDQQHTQNYGWNIFYTIARQRLAAAADGGKVFLLRSLEIEEDIWGKASSFELTYTFITKSVDNFVQSMLTDSGIWQPIGTDWNRWSASMGKVFDQYGASQLRTRPETDLIVDLCSNDTIPWGGDSVPAPIAQKPQQTIFQNRKPDPKQSYISYLPGVRPYSTNSVQRQSAMQPSDYEIGSSDPTQANGYQSRGPMQVPDIIQQSGGGQYGIELFGTATRAGYPVPRPILEQAGTQQPVQTYFNMPQSIVANWFGVPIYQAAWRIRYALANAPGSFPIQPNPREGLDGNGNAQQGT